ncbi:hypothetical protein ACH5RR_022428 [Cinchona calisaya]|uniref:Mediator complex subunit 15 KIX domain-containing protein n=1 Tax=Cinchona calisaya TaxID=153742 RepID=A0ABD2Z7S1_9GENT
MDNLLGENEPTTMEIGDWRAQLLIDPRKRIVSRIAETVGRLLPVSGPDEIRRIAVTFEEKIYKSATSQSDYLRKISLKMLTLGTKNHNPANANTNYTRENPTDLMGHTIKKRRFTEPSEELMIKPSDAADKDE